MAIKDLTGQKFERLTAIKIAGRIRRSVLWECKCECGNICFVESYNLTSGHTKSCGCLKSISKLNKHDLTGQQFGKLTVVKKCKF